MKRIVIKTPDPTPVIEVGQVSSHHNIAVKHPQGRVGVVLTSFDGKLYIKWSDSNESSTFVSLRDLMANYPQSEFYQL